MTAPTAPAAIVASHPSAHRFSAAAEAGLIMMASSSPKPKFSASRGWREAGTRRGSLSWRDVQLEQAGDLAVNLIDLDGVTAGGALGVGSSLGALVTDGDPPETDGIPGLDRERVSA